MIVNYILKSIFLFTTYLFVYLSVRKINNNINKMGILSIVVIICVSICNALSFKISNELFKGLITLSSLCLFSLEINKTLSKKIIIDGFVSYIHVAVVETAMAIIMILLGFGNFMSNTDNMNVYKLGYSTFYAVCLYFSLYIRLWRKFLSSVRNILINSKLFIFIMTLILLAFEVSTILTIMNTKNNKDVFLSCVLLLLTGICISDLLYNVKKKQELRLINSNLIMKSDSLFKILNNYKMFKHNMKHELMAISAVGDKKVKSLVKSYLKEHESTNVGNISEISNIPDGFKSLIYQKILESSNLNVNINVDNLLKFDPFEKLSIKKICKLSQCIGIAFDNAIEASSKCEDGFIYMKFEYVNGNFIITFENNFNSMIDVDNVLNYGVTSKDGHMGIGTSYLINQNMINSKITIRNNNFVVRMSVSI